MSNIRIDYGEVGNVISLLQQALSDNQTKINNDYSSLVNAFLESSGEEADAIRELQKAEQEVLTGVLNMLSQFAQSIQFAVDEFKNVDTTVAKVMEGNINVRG